MKGLREGIQKYLDASKYHTAAGLSRKSGVTEATISRIITGKQDNTTVETWYAIHKAIPEYVDAPDIVERIKADLLKAKGSAQIEKISVSPQPEPAPTKADYEEIKNMLNALMATVSKVEVDMKPDYSEIIALQREQLEAMKGILKAKEDLIAAMQTQIKVNEDLVVATQEQSTATGKAEDKIVAAIKQIKNENYEKRIAELEKENNFHKKDGERLKAYTEKVVRIISKGKPNGTPRAA